MLALISELSPRTRLSLSVRKHVAAEEQRCEVSRLPSVVSVHPHSSQVGKALLSPPLPPPSHACQNHLLPFRCREPNIAFVQTGARLHMSIELHLRVMGLHLALEPRGSLWELKLY